MRDEAPARINLTNTRRAVALLAEKGVRARCGGILRVGHRMTSTCCQAPAYTPGKPASDCWMHTCIWPHTLVRGVSLLAEPIMCVSAVLTRSLRLSSMFDNYCLVAALGKHHS